MNRLGFYVVAPQSQITAGIFQSDLDKSSLEKKVHRRVSEYEGEKDSWFSEWFQPTVDHLDIQCISWEGIINHIKEADATVGNELETFYSNCLKFNGTLSTNQ